MSSSDRRDNQFLGSSGEESLNTGISGSSSNGETSGAQRLRLGDAERIAGQRMAYADNGHADILSSDHESSLQEEIASSGEDDIDDIRDRLIAALKGEDDAPIAGPVGGGNSYPLGHMASQQQIPPQTNYQAEPAGQPTEYAGQYGQRTSGLQAPYSGGGLRAPQQFRPAPYQAAAIPVPTGIQVRPMPMGGPTRAPMTPLARIPAGASMMRAPIAPMRRGTARSQGLRLREAIIPGPMALPISRAQSLYEILNRSSYTPRPMRRPAPTSAAQGVSYTPPVQEAAMGESEAERPVALEVQDAINVILQSLPQGASANRPQEVERAEALRRVRLLRAQLVGLQDKISQATQEEGAQLAERPQAQAVVPPSAGFMPPVAATTTMHPGFANPIQEASVDAANHPIIGQQMRQPEPIPAPVNPVMEDSPQPGQYGGEVAQASQPTYRYDEQGTPILQHAEVDEWQISEQPSAAEHDHGDASWHGNAGAPGHEIIEDGFYDDELPKGIVPNIQDNSKSNSSWMSGRAGGLIGGMALAASIGGAAFFVDGQTGVFQDLTNRLKTAYAAKMNGNFTDPASSDSATYSTAAVSLQISEATLTKTGASGITLSVLDASGPAAQPIDLVLSVPDTIVSLGSVVRFKGVPPGASLVGGFNAGAGTWLVPGDKIANLKLSVPDYFTGKFDLQAQVLASDAVTAVSNMAVFSVQVGTASGSDDQSKLEQVASQPQTKIGARFDKSEDAGITTSTVNQTVPTARFVPHSEAVVSPKTKIAALSPKASNIIVATNDPIAKLIQSGDTHLQVQDISSARKLYKKAADLGSADAALALGRTYDPVYFEMKKVPSKLADTKQALIWYQEALSRGNVTARSMVDRLLKWVQKKS